MRKGIVAAAAAIVLMVTGIVIGKATIQSAAAPSSPHVTSAFDLMSTAQELPVAPHPDAI
jgi:hypothetical protein